MKNSLYIATVLGLTVLLNSCIYEEPVFTKDFAKADESLSGVWVRQEGEDPRTSEYAVCAPIDENRYVLHHPVRSSDSFYYEARPLQRRGRTLLQLRALATFRAGPSKPDSKHVTILWISKKADDRLLIRAVKGDSELASLSPAEARKFLEDPSSDWEPHFDETREFRRL